MGYIHCCGGKRKAKSYVLSPEKKYLTAEIDYLDECPVCGHSVTQLTRIDFDNNISVFRKTNEKAKKMFENLKSSILFEKITGAFKLKAYSRFYLNYNEFGKKKRCYSNLSTLKMGLFDNESRLLASTSINTSRP